MKKHLYISANYDFNQICPGLNETILAKRSLDKHPFSDSAETSQVVDHLIHAHDLRSCPLHHQGWDYMLDPPCNAQLAGDGNKVLIGHVIMHFAP